MRAAGDVLAHAAGGDLDRAREPARAEGAVRDDGELPQPEQDRSALLLGVELVAQPAQRGLQQQPAELGAPARTSPRPRTAPSSAAEEPSMTFSATLPVKPSATITSAAPVPIAKPSTLPTKFRPVEPASASWAATTISVPLVASVPLDEQRHARARRRRRRPP